MINRGQETRLPWLNLKTYRRGISAQANTGNRKELSKKPTNQPILSEEPDDLNGLLTQLAWKSR